MAKAKYQFTPVFDEAAFEEIQDAADVAKVVYDGASAFTRAGATDAEETMVFARQLETVRNKMYEIKYPEYIARTLVPVVVEDGDSEFVTMRVWDFTAVANVISDYSSDFKKVTATAKEYFVKFFDIGNAYDYHIRDLRRAAKAGVALDTMKARAARRGIELGIEDAIAVGVPSLRTFGLTNHPNVSLVTLTTGNWTSATSEQILADLNQLITTMWTSTLEIFRPDTILVSTAAYRLLTTRLMSAGNSSNASVLEVFLKQNPGITVRSWTKLANANAAGNNGRMVVYKRDAEVMEFIMGRDFEVFPAVQTGMTFDHHCMAQVAGLAVHYPAAVFYVDNQLI